MDSAGLDAGDISHYHGSGCGYSHNQPYDAEEEKTGQGNQFQRQGMTRRVVFDGSKCHQEHDGRESRDDHQPDIDGAVQDLTGVAVNAFHEMLLVVATHLGREPGDVVTPSRKNPPDHLVTA